MAQKLDLGVYTPTDEKCRFNNGGRTKDCGMKLYRDLDGCLLCPVHSFMFVNNL